MTAILSRSRATVAPQSWTSSGSKTARSSSIGTSCKKFPSHPPTTIRCSSKDMRLSLRTVQDLLGHRDLSRPMIYTHVLNRGPDAVRSPADRLSEP